MKQIFALLMVLGFTVSCSHLYNERGISSVDKQAEDDRYYERTGLAGMH